MFTDKKINLSINQSTNLSVYQSINLPIYPSINLSISFTHQLLDILFAEYFRDGNARLNSQQTDGILRLFRAIKQIKVKVDHTSCVTKNIHKEGKGPLYIYVQSPNFLKTYIEN